MFGNKSQWEKQVERDRAIPYFPIDQFFRLDRFDGWSEMTYKSVDEKRKFESGKPYEYYYRNSIVCTHCGSPKPENYAPFCPNCGDEKIKRQPAHVGQREVTREEFYIDEQYLKSLREGTY